MASLTTKRRNALPTSEFALPGRKYPIDTAARARNALARVAQFGSPEEKAAVRKAVANKYPAIDVEGPKPHAFPPEMLSNPEPSKPPHATAKKVHGERMAHATSMRGS